LDSGLTIKDLDTIAKAFMRVFRGMYHERVPYPDAKALAEAREGKKKEEIAEDKAQEEIPLGDEAKDETKMGDSD